MKIEVKVTDCGSMFDALFSDTPEDVVRTVNRIIDKAHTEGYTSLHIRWSSYDDQTPHLYGRREETASEKADRTKKQQQETERKAKAKERKIQKAQAVLVKYGIDQQQKAQ